MRRKNSASGQPLGGLTKHHAFQGADRCSGFSLKEFSSFLSLICFHVWAHKVNPETLKRAKDSGDLAGGGRWGGGGVGRWRVQGRLGQSPRKWTCSYPRKASSRRVRGEERAAGRGAEGRAGAQLVRHLRRGSRGCSPENIPTSQVPWRDLAPSGDRVNGKKMLFISVESGAVPGPSWKQCLTLTQAPHWLPPSPVDRMQLSHSSLQ